MTQIAPFAIQIIENVAGETRAFCFALVSKGPPLCVCAPGVRKTFLRDHERSLSDNEVELSALPYT